MKIQPTQLNKPQPTFGIYQKTKITEYAYKSYIKKDYGRFKDYSIYIQKNYLMGKLASTLISIKKGEKWLKSKLKYFDNGIKKVIRSEAK